MSRIIYWGRRVENPFWVTFKVIFNINSYDSEDGVSCWGHLPAVAWTAEMMMIYIWLSVLGGFFWLDIHTYIYIYVYICMYIHIHIYTYWSVFAHRYTHTFNMLHNITSLLFAGDHNSLCMYNTFVVLKHPYITSVSIRFTVNKNKKVLHKQLSLPFKATQHWYEQWIITPVVYWVIIYIPQAGGTTPVRLCKQKISVIIPGLVDFSI